MRPGWESPPWAGSLRRRQLREYGRWDRDQNGGRVRCRRPVYHQPMADSFLLADHETLEIAPQQRIARRLCLVTARERTRLK